MPSDELPPLRCAKLFQKKMVKILVVDNGGQWTHREWRVLKYCGADSEIIQNDTPVEDLKDVDGIVLSGGAPRIASEFPKLGNCGEYLDKLEVPILGMCLSHQFMALHKGGEAGPAAVPEFGLAKLEISDEHLSNPIFKDIPKESQVWESHNDEIKTLPEEFINMASSKDCKHQSIKHREKPIYGFQFHPEVEQTEHGTKIFENFVELCKAHSSSKISGK